MRVFFSMRHLGFFRMYESAIREMAERGGALLHEDPAGVGRVGPHFSGPSAGATLQAAS